jgi:putative two-component system response regulator
MGEPVPESSPQPASILLVAARPQLERALVEAAVGAVTVIADPAHVASIPADIVIVDFALPDATAALRRLAVRGGSTVTIAVAERSQAADAIAAGAKDVIEDAANTIVIGARLRSLLEMQEARRLLADEKAVLEQQVKERTKRLHDAFVEHLERLAYIAEFNDDDTRDHTQRVGRVSALLAEGLGQDSVYVEQIRLAAPLHDIGKIGVETGVLRKRTKLDPSELEHMRSHPIMGARMLWGVHDPILRMAQEIALCHHERWDGQGYPAGFHAEEIPLAARIVAVADMFDALTHKRPYKHAWPVNDALEEMMTLRGTHFEPRIVDTFASLVRGGALARIGWE